MMRIKPTPKSKSLSDAKPKIPVWVTPPLRSANILGINEIKIDDNLSAILSRLDGKLSIEIRPDKSVSALVVTRVGNTKICELADIRRVGTSRRFIMDAERKTASTSALLPVEKKIFDIQRKLGCNPRPLSPMDISNVKVLELENRVITANELRFENRGWENYPIDVWLRHMFCLAKDLITQLLAIIAKGEEFRGAKHALMLQLGIPKWIYNRMIDKTFGIAQPSIYKLIFPTDAFKGISFTIAELRDVLFCRRNASVLQASKALVALMRDDDFVCLYGGAINVDLTETNNTTQAILGCKVLAVPAHLGRIDDYLVPKSLGKRSKFVQGNIQTVAGRITELSRAFVQATLGETLFMGGNFVLWSTILDENHAGTILRTQGLNPFSYITENENAKALFETWYDPKNHQGHKINLVKQDLQIAPAGEMAGMFDKALEKALLLTAEWAALPPKPDPKAPGAEEGKTEPVLTIETEILSTDLARSGRTPGPIPKMWDWNNLASDNTGFEQARLIYRQGMKDNAPIKRGRRAPISRLTSTTKERLRPYINKGKRFESISNDVLDWLGSFVEIQVQELAADLLANQMVDYDQLESESSDSEEHVDI